MSAVHEAILKCLTDNVAARSEWNEPPALYLVILRGGEPALEELPIAEKEWRKAPAPRILEQLASGAAVGKLLGTRPPMPTGLHGAAFYSESWTVPMQDVEWETVKADAYARRVSRRPDRVEVRFMTAVDRGGTQYAVMAPRGTHTEAHIMYPTTNPEGTFATGSIVESLDILVQALLDVPMPERPVEPE